VRSWTLNASEVEMIDDTVKGDTSRTFKGGLVSPGTATVVCWLDYVTGQQDVIDYITAGTSTGYSLVLTVDTGKTFTADAISQGFTVSSPEGSSIVEVTYTFQLSGDITVAWA
jgi:hypothetical protein